MHRSCIVCVLVVDFDVEEIMEEFTMEDINVLDFARKISMITIDTPLSIEFDNKYGQKKDKWWTSQREHMVAWCLHYPTKGVERYNHKPSDSAREVYNRFGRPETLLWLIEALGEDKNRVCDIINKIEDISNPKTACSIIRKEISFDRVLQLLSNID